MHLKRSHLHHFSFWSSFSFHMLESQNRPNPTAAASDLKQRIWVSDTAPLVLRAAVDSSWFSVHICYHWSFVYSLEKRVDSFDKNFQTLGYLRTTNLFILVSRPTQTKSPILKQSSPPDSWNDHLAHHTAVLRDSSHAFKHFAHS